MSKDTINALEAELERMPKQIAFYERAHFQECVDACYAREKEIKNLLAIYELVL